MKQTCLLVFTFCLLLSSCSKQTFYEVCHVQSSLPYSNGKYEYKDKSCTILYDFWSNGGNAGFTIINNTNEILYVDLSKTFFIRNGNAYDYYLNRTTSTSASVAENASASKSGTAYGYWNTVGGITPGSIAATVGISSSTAKSKSVAIEEKSIVAVPPQASKKITEYAITNSYFYGCDHNITPTKKETPTYDFQLSNTPLTFGNFITYRIGNNSEENCIVNDFFISSITFYHSASAFVKQKVGCPKEETTIKVMKDANPRNFYIRYFRILNNSPEKK